MIESIARRLSQLVEPVAVVTYNFADGEVARHIPRVWNMVTPEAADAARQQGSVTALRRILGDLADLADVAGVARAGDLLTKAATSAPTHGRALYAAVRPLPVPTEPVARLWHEPTCCATTAVTATWPLS